MTLVAFPNLIIEACNMPYLVCMTCNKEMNVILAEPVSEGFEIRSFRCSACDITEEFVTKF